MDALVFFSAAFALSLMGSLPFGMINLNVLSTAVHRGRVPALWMALGAVLVEGGQLVVILAGFQQLSENPGLEQLLRRIALPIFLVLAIYFLRTRTRTDLAQADTGRPFVKGLGLSVINVLVYPFWLIWLAWLDFPVERLGLWLPFIVGAIAGAFASMLGFIFLGRIITRRAGELTTHLNRFIAMIFLGLALWESWHWLKA